MKLATKIAAGMLMGIGLPITLMASLEILNPQTPAADRADASAALVILGISPAVLGGWLAWNGQQKGDRAEQERLRNTFFRLLQEGNGHLTVLKFAMTTGLEGEAAKAYLNDRAREFNASFNVSEEGKLSYYFDLGSAATLPPAAEETYAVILDFVAPKNRREVVRELKQLLNLSWDEAKDIVKKSLSEPTTICQSLTKAEAETYRRRLEAVGAHVLVVLN
jgi:ribosomal protein L7/L12